MKKVLITGGAGFIGSHLAEALLGEGKEVAVIDDLSTGKLSNIRHLMSNPKFSYHVNTIMNERLMKRLMRRCDVVYHLAAAVGVKYIIDNPLQAIRTNVRGTEIVLKIANSSGKKKVVLASTSEIYGKDRPGKQIFNEGDDRLLGPTTTSRWSYSCTKALDEFLALAYWREEKLPIVIVRFFNTCGPRQTGRYGMVVPRFIQQAISGKPITIYGDGKQTRCFTYISDSVKAVVMLSKNPRAVGKIFNVGNPDNKITINALAKKIKVLTHSKSAIRRISYAKAYHKGFEDMRHRGPDISRLKAITGFKPAVDTKNMLVKIIGSFKKP